MQNLPYQDIQTYLRVVELGSIRAAAQELGQEPSSVSRRMTQLERRLGTQLLMRGQGRTQVSEPGMRYYESMRQLLPQLLAAEADAAGDADTVKGLLRVSAPIDFGQRFVARWLLDFQKLNPELEIELKLSSDFVDLAQVGVDVAIRTGILQDSSLRARRLAMVPRVLVASQDYLGKFGIPREPADLADHNMIFFSPAHRNRPLSLKGPDEKVHTIMCRGSVTINAVTSCVQAVETGAGIHYGPRWAFQGSIDRGMAREILPEYRGEALPMQALFQNAVVLPARIRGFVDFAVGQATTVPGLYILTSWKNTLICLFSREF